MPRLSNEENPIAEAVPRKRVVRRTVAKKSVTTTPRVTPSVTRRAPTTIASTVQSNKRTSKRYAILAVVMLVVVISAALIGNSDSGAVDVQARIAEKEQNEGRANIDVNNDNSGSEVVPVQNTPPVVPVSRLKGRGVGTAPAAQPNPAEEVPVEGSATSSEATSTAPTEESAIEETPPVEKSVVESEVEPIVPAE